MHHLVVSEHLREKDARLGFIMVTHLRKVSEEVYYNLHTSVRYRFLIFKGVLSEMYLLFRNLVYLCSPGCYEYLKTKSTTINC